MPYYRTSGKVPRKRHTTFRSTDGVLYQEELFGTEGFAGDSSLLYHLHPPTRVTALGKVEDMRPSVSDGNHLQARCFSSFKNAPRGGGISGRKVLLFNNDLRIGIAAPQKGSEDFFYKNASGDEILFIHKGSGTVHSAFGPIPFGAGDYVVIPRGCIYTISIDQEECRMLVLEAAGAIRPPRRYLSHSGQFLENAPWCERDIRPPGVLKTHDEQGAYKVLIRKGDYLHHYEYANHPFDLVGWDGCNYPYAVSIYDFEPITGRIHQPPPVHQQFEGKHFVVCSFVPRLYDYHPDSIPAPYHHSNIDSDEVIYYVDGDFMSRNHIGQGQITLHPGGIPHGPHPGAIERSIGQKSTNEYAVMIDPFNPLVIAADAVEIEEKDYYKSWL